MSLTRRKTSMWWTTMVTRGKNEKKSITPGIKWGHCVYFLWFVSGRIAISTVIWTKYLDPDIWSVSVNSTNETWNTIDSVSPKNTGLFVSRPEKTADISTHDMVFPRNDVWQMSAEIPYWWHVTTQIWVVLPLVVPRGRFDSTNQEHYPGLGNNTSSVLNFGAV